MTRLKYLDPADGQYKLLPVGGGSGGGPDEVTIGPSTPSSPYTDLWVDTDEPAPVTDWSVADNRYLTSGFRNQFRNGDMQIAQRGNGPFTISSACTADGWYQTFTGGAVSTSRVPQAPGAGSPLMVTTVSGQSAANHYASFMQNIEDVNTFSGQTVTMSFSMKAASGAPKIAVELQQAFGTGGSPSATVVTLVKDQLSISTTLSRYSFTFTVPSVAGKTLGTNNNSKLSVIINYSLGSSYSPAEGTIGIQNNTFSITDVQIEAGSTASPFERLPVQQQLAWCQRYFWRLSSDAGYGMFGFGTAGVTTSVRVAIPLQVKMRAGVTCSFSAPNTFRVVDGTSTPTVTSLAVGTNGLSVIGVDISATVIQFRPYWLDANGAANAYIDFSAEL